MSKDSPRMIMAFDFGTKNIGIAIGQEITKTASTFYSIRANDGLPDWVELDMIVKEWDPNLFVVGDPLNMDGTRSDFMKKVEKFAKKLRSKIDIEIEFFDERLTSFEARQLDEDSEMIDDVAAKIILDSWLNNEHS